MPSMSQRVEVGEERLAYRFGSEAFTAGDAGARTASAGRVISRSIDHYSLSDNAHRGRRLPDRVFLHPRLPAVDFDEDGSHPAITVRASRDSSSPNVHAHDEFPTAHPGGRRDSHSSHSSATQGAPPTDGVVLFLMEQLHAQQLAAQEQRRLDRLENEAREARTLELVRQLMAMSQASREPVGPRYSAVGTALAALPTFAGDPGEDYGAYLESFEAAATAHGIPEQYWPNELVIKLTGKAQSWFAAAFPRTGPFPTWLPLTAGLQRLFGRKYIAANVWYNLYSARRLPHETGRAALQRVTELENALTHLGVPINPGSNERKAYLLQLQLTADELGRWIAAANSSSDASDDAIRAKEVAAVAALSLTSRLSVGATERDLWFAPRLAHLETFFEDQPAAPGPTPARAAVVDATPDPAPAPAVPQPRARPSTAGTTQVTPHSPPISPRAAGPDHAAIPDVTVWEARLYLARAERIAAGTGTGQPNQTPLPPPTYHGPNPKFLAKNQAEFARRRDCGACFACSMQTVQYDTFHTLCPQHGRDASKTQRSSKRVVGAGLTRPGAL